MTSAASVTPEPPEAPLYNGVLVPRHEPRVAMSYPVDLFSSGFAGPLRACSRDIGLGGVCVESASIFALGSLRRVVLELPGADVAPAETAVVEEDAVILDVTRSGFEMSRPSRPWLAQRLAQAVNRVYARRAAELLARGAAATKRRC